MGMRITSLVLAGLLALTLTGCGQSQEGEQTGLPAENLKAGLLLYGSEETPYDRGHVAGLEKALTQLDLDPESQLVVMENVPENEDCMQAIEELIDQGCQIIFSGTKGHEAYLAEAALRYPKVTFCHAAGYQAASDNLDNTHNYYAKIQDARYLSGIAAGLRTETDTLGFVASRSYGEMISAYTAFYLGAKSVNPDVTMLVTYTNAWADEEKETAAAQSLIDLGCDVLSYHTNLDTTAAVAEANGVYVVGCHGEVTGLAPDSALLSCQIDWGTYYLYALNCLLQGQEIAQDWCGSYSDGACSLTAVNREAAAPDTEEAINAAAAGLADGTVAVFAGPLYGIDADGNQLTLAEGSYYEENKDRSAPSFAYLMEGITLLP